MAQSLTLALTNGLRRLRDLVPHRLEIEFLVGLRLTIARD